MNLSIIWKLQDLMSPVLIRVQRTAGTAQAAIERANAVMQSGFRRSGDSVTSLRDKIDTLRRYRDGLRIGIDTREIRMANGELNTLQRQLDRIERSNAGASSGRGIMGRLMPGGIRGMAAGIGLFGAVAAGQSILNKGMDTDLAEQQFTYFTKNAEKAQNIINQLKQYSDKYAVYNRGQLLNSATAIADTFGADRVMELTQMVGKLAKGNSANFDGIIGRLQQIRGTGYLQGDELMELMNRGVFGLQEEIATFKKITIPKFNKLKEQQKISYADVEAALLRMTSAGGKYDKVLDVTMASARGKWTAITGIVKSKLTDIGKGVAVWLIPVFDTIQRFLKSMQPIETAFSNLGKAFKPLFDSLYRIIVAFGLVKQGSDGVMTVIGLISGVVNVLAKVVSLAASGIGFIGDLFARYPWTKYAAGFLAIGYAIQTINFMGIAANLTYLGLQFIGFPFRTIMTSLAGLRTAFAALNVTMLLNPVFLIVSGVVALGAAIYYAWNNSEAFRKVTIQVWEGLKAVWTWAADLVLQAWEKIKVVYYLLKMGWKMYMDFILSVTMPVFNWITEKFNLVVEKLGQAINWIKDKFKSLWDGVATGAARTASVIASAFSFALPSAVLAKFKEGFDKGGAVAAAFEKNRKIQDKVGKKLGVPGMTDSPSGFGSMPSFGALGASSKDPGGVSDTVKGSVTKQITINLNSPIANISQYFSSGDKNAASALSDEFIEQLNRVLLTGDRLAVE